MDNHALKNLDSEKALLQKRISEIEFQRQEILRSQKPKSNSERWEEVKRKSGYVGKNNKPLFSHGLEEWRISPN